MFPQNPLAVLRWISQVNQMFWLTWATELAARLDEGGKEQNWVPVILSSSTHCRLELNRNAICCGLDFQQAAARADAMRRFCKPSYEKGRGPDRLATPGELQEIFHQCGHNLPLGSLKTAWLSATRGIGKDLGTGFCHDGTVLTVTRDGILEWHGPEGKPSRKYGVLLVRDVNEERFPS